MAIRKVRKIGDPVLREKSRDIEKIDRGVLDLVKDMLDTLQDEGGVGLAAPQIGIARNVIIVLSKTASGSMLAISCLTSCTSGICLFSGIPD